ncbi:uncharacterized protein LOC134824782 [Bolinopsis microptera]|uniref:uncharacterized protein LOC134824782 n=1 Tax=Bolinopsis microptera TaxID=2820187 RepID=UPI0030792029
MSTSPFTTLYFSDLDLPRDRHTPTSCWGEVEAWRPLEQSTLRRNCPTLITPGDSLRSNYLENKIEKLNDLPSGSVKLSYSKKINSYDEILEQQRASLGLQIDDLSTEILDNARNTNDVSQSLSVGDSDARTSRLENLGSARQYIADKIQLLNKERLKKCRSWSLNHDVDITGVRGVQNSSKSCFEMK